MTRRHVTFDCEGSLLAGTLDEGSNTTGLLIVSGGNELRSGAWAGQAQFAARIASENFPTFRFDRRGVGDSEGTNAEFSHSAPDITAALAKFRADCPHLTRVIGLGNCDAASALMLAKGAGLDGLVLTNPWTIEQEDAAPPPDALRDHYRRRLLDPSAIKRLLTGQVSIGKLFASLKGAISPPPPPSSLAQDMAEGIDSFQGQILFLLAERDRTAQAFQSAWKKRDTRVRVCTGASHSFVEADAREWLVQEVLGILRG
jgi:exosortase A-associated hydrolase 1